MNDKKKQLLYEQFEKLSQDELNVKFSEECCNGNLELVKYLLTSPELEKHAYLDSDNNTGFEEACENGHLNIVRYLLTSPDLKQHANIHKCDDEGSPDGGFIYACKKGHLEIVKYLLTSPELKDHVDIHASDDLGLWYACFNGYVDIVEYLLTSKELKDYADIYADNQDAFKTISSMDDNLVLNYLIFDFNIHETESIKEYLEENNLKQVKDMFKARDLQKKLVSELSSDKINNKKKMKL